MVKRGKTRVRLPSYPETKTAEDNEQGRSSFASHTSQDMPFASSSFMIIGNPSVGIKSSADFFMKMKKKKAGRV
jgi:hypothetical protein